MEVSNCGELLFSNQAKRMAVSGTPGDNPAVQLAMNGELT